MTTTTNQTHVTIGLLNPKSATNVGAVLRAAQCYKADAIRYTGQRWERGAKFHTDTKNAAAHFDIASVDDLLTTLPPNTAVVCVDLVEGATALPEFEHPANAIYVFGPEDGSIPQPMIDRADRVTYVPTIGCLNLAATVNVVLYDRLAKSNSTFGGDELIRASRDNNNQTQFKSAMTQTAPTDEQ
ncbi:RNA methyltransferase [Neiella marina]|uniref:RNA methyltransferase n=1 Tax=Neiella holothuriorum TaxID=2870530 RepID=A0ABS7EBA2_9GAMM|nr:RNA methyltransferase [Neiella holothuriorum]MBW8189609.1 RNA methyltransferase [Neiella holothuriorum]